jgi:hypothetical protein
MTADEAKVKIAEHDAVQRRLREEFLKVVAAWEGGKPPARAVDLWTDILRIEAVIGQLEGYLPDEEKRSDE